MHISETSITNSEALPHPNDAPKVRERPILMSAEMVRAALDDRKTQTRRLIHYRFFLCLDPELDEDLPNLLAGCPYGKPGDRLWVREAFRVTEVFDSVYYRADDSDPVGDKWRPSIFMPRRLSRLTLEVTGVRVERLRDIPQKDAIAEGMPCTVFAKSEFANLWNKINGKRAPWASNPWVWVIEFKRLKPEPVLA